MKGVLDYWSFGFPVIHQSKTPLLQLPMTPTYHLVSHTHWDREWYLSFEQFRAMLVRMVDDLLDLLARDPEYKCFTLDGQTIVLEDYLAIKPERAEEIRRLV